MPTKLHFSKLVQSFIPYTTLIIFLVIISWLARVFLGAESKILEEPQFQAFVLGSVFFVAYYINRIAPHTIIPSFVWAIFAGIAIQPLLAIYTKDISGLKIIIEICAALVLFSGGLDIPFKDFKKWFFPIASLSLVGVLLSAVIFSAALLLLTKVFGLFEILLIPSIVILSAALASTDPTAIIPTLAHLRFKRGFLKQIAIAESALTDISGSIITAFLLAAFIGVAPHNSNFLIYFLPLLQKSAYNELALQIVSGVLVGYLGFALIKKFYYTERSAKSKKEGSADPSLLLSVPIFTFVLGNFLGGSAGFLSAFFSGLLTDASGGLKKVARFYENLLNHLVKPFIFIILGALVPINTLIRYAPLGIIMALVFMFVIRPAVTFISLSPWLFKHTFIVKDVLFLSFIRETGIIAAVLLIIASSSNIINSHFIIAIGMWVILLTLIVEPPLTPYIAKKIGVAKVEE
jgi:cell volume regulation protein A